MSALPPFSDVDLLGYGKRIVDLNSEIADCTLDSSVAQQELNCSKISRFLIDHLGTGRVLEVMIPSILAAAGYRLPLTNTQVTYSGSPLRFISRPTD